MSIKPTASKTPGQLVIWLKTNLLCVGSRTYRQHLVDCISLAPCTLDWTPSCERFGEKPFSQLEKQFVWPDPPPSWFFPLPRSTIGISNPIYKFAELGLACLVILIILSYKNCEWFCVIINRVVEFHIYPKRYKKSEYLELYCVFLREGGPLHARIQNIFECHLSSRPIFSINFTIWINMFEFRGGAYIGADLTTPPPGV